MRKRYFYRLIISVLRGLCCVVAVKCTTFAFMTDAENIRLLEWQLTHYRRIIKNQAETIEHCRQDFNRGSRWHDKCIQVMRDRMQVVAELEAVKAELEAVKAELDKLKNDDKS